MRHISFFVFGFLLLFTIPNAFAQPTTIQIKLTAEIGQYPTSHWQIEWVENGVTQTKYHNGMGIETVNADIGSTVRVFMLESEQPCSEYQEQFVFSDGQIEWTFSVVSGGFYSHTYKLIQLDNNQCLSNGGGGGGGGSGGGGGGGTAGGVLVVPYKYEVEKHTDNISNGVYCLNEDPMNLQRHYAIITSATGSGSTVTINYIYYTPTTKNTASATFTQTLFSSFPNPKIWGCKLYQGAIYVYMTVLVGSTDTFQETLIKIVPLQTTATKVFEQRSTTDCSTNCYTHNEYVGKEWNYNRFAFSQTENDFFFLRARPETTNLQLVLSQGKTPNAGVWTTVATINLPLPIWFYAKNNFFFHDNNKFYIAGELTAFSTTLSAVENNVFQSHTPIGIDSEYYYFVSNNGTYYRLTINKGIEDIYIEPLNPFANHNIYTQPLLYQLPIPQSRYLGSAHTTTNGFYGLIVDLSRRVIYDDNEWKYDMINTNYVLSNLTSNSLLHFYKLSEFVMQEITITNDQINSFVNNVYVSSVMLTKNHVYRTPITSGVVFKDEIEDVVENMPNIFFHVARNNLHLEAQFEYNNMMQQWIYTNSKYLVYEPILEEKNKQIELIFNTPIATNVIMLMRDRVYLFGEVLETHTTSYTLEIPNRCYTLEFYLYSTFSLIHTEYVCGSVDRYILNLNYIGDKIIFTESEIYSFRTIDNNDIRITKIKPIYDITRTIKIVEAQGGNVVYENQHTLSNTPLTVSVSNTKMKYVYVLKSDDIVAFYVWNVVTNKWHEDIVNQLRSWFGYINPFFILIVLAMSLWSRSTLTIIPAGILLIVFIGDYYSAITIEDYLITIIAIGILALIFVKRYI